MLVGHLRTGRIVEELPGVVDFTDTLSDTGSARLSVPLTAVPKSVNLAGVTAPWRTFLAVVRGAAVLWAGPVITRRRPIGSATIEIGAAGLLALFDRRILARTGPWSPTDEQADVVLNGLSLDGIAVEVMRAALNRPDGDLPLVLPRASPGPHFRRYFGHELASAGQRLRQLSTLRDGPDIHFAPRLRPDGSAIEWVARLGTPHLGAPTEHHFDYGAALLDWGFDEDGARMASHVSVPGDGVERGRVIGRANTADLVEAGWPPLDLVVGDFSSVKHQSTLDSHARAYAEVLATGVVTDTAVVRGDLEPAPGSYLVGDHVALTPRPDRWTPAGTVHRRIMQISSRPGERDELTLSLAEVPATV
ncbi:MULTISPECIES: hypothetical protein [unclassified Crossiella]|uniref:hypothetical protein n=1 Tax=unclassified Crossiella TaxID=2620835 RepID=UPI001FFFD4C7|nr:MULTISPECIES: hypothetical protein [unclassified Crossiella]MCK2237701.1 hypothetical protein [Crossiella sp. S99.2]MCK2254987.1 hypothetical protein [Crossiella sp. S99.1]